MTSPNLLARVKRLLDIADTTKDDVLNDFIEMYDRAICLHTGTNLTPSELEFVLIELVITRFNLIGSEGLKSERIDLVSNTFNDDIFKTFLPYIEQWKSLNTPSSGKPRLRVL
ncbi:phage head-tail connector protein [Sporosarcina saromensis]|uniref:Phage head-tail connector protein n=1 Tax=Sporosarcina saromensis TaxID=359365 RepID=A0ABU4G5A6_9BACL|nr:phage head-tail connector protein [Sporosarcina saromensis]MDW0112160.1 phage head-tail connector protein [Sporosarcina saromensis]